MLKPKENTGTIRWSKNILLLKWVAIFVPAMLFVLIDLIWEMSTSVGESGMPDFLWIHMVAALTIVALSYTIFNFLARFQYQMTQDNRTLAIAEERDRTAREMHDGMVSFWDTSIPRPSP